MKKTAEQLKNEFITLLTANSFEKTDSTDCAGNEIYAREWKRLSWIAWEGERETTFRMEARISYGYPLVRLIEGGRMIDTRDYSSPKRAINAMREIARCAGYEF